MIMQTFNLHNCFLKFVSNFSVADYKMRYAYRLENQFTIIKLIYFTKKKYFYTSNIFDLLLFSQYIIYNNIDAT